MNKEFFFLSEGGNLYTDKFCNPVVMWGKYRKGWFKTTLPISFQFHHVQMNGGHGAMFLGNHSLYHQQHLVTRTRIVTY